MTQFERYGQVPPPRSDAPSGEPYQRGGPTPEWMSEDPPWAMPTRRRSASMGGDSNVACMNVIRTYRISSDDTVQALNGVDLELQPGTVTALIGPSGSGKSTLLRLLACVDRPDSGLILIQGRDTARLSRARRVKFRRRRLGYMFQNPADNLIEYLTVRQHLRLAARMRGVRLRRREMDELLDRLGIGAKANNLPRQLSGGEQQRASIAFAAVGPPALLVADEPTGQLDHDTVGDVLDAFAALASTGVTIVAATHDPIVAQRADRVVHMVDGRIEEER
ncbi:MAG TPA: ABC transporter ATP-binding protein [Micromonosporaceae bacterium]|nr:ABC transporter ATP-binding protein [Micromonosporaceae bacterium]